MGKAVVIIAAIMGFLSVLLFFVSSFLGSWWFMQMSGSYEDISMSMGVYMDSFGVLHGEFMGITMSEQALGAPGSFAGIVTLLGALLLLIGGATEKKGLGIAGAMIIILGPILFIASFLMGVSDALPVDNYYSQMLELFYGSRSSGGASVTWGLGPGFYLALAGGIMGIVGSAKLESGY